MKRYKSFFKESRIKTLWVTVPGNQKEKFIKVIQNSNWYYNSVSQNSFNFEVTDQADANALEIDMSRDRKLIQFDMQFEFEN